MEEEAYNQIQMTVDALKDRSFPMVFAQEIFAGIISEVRIKKNEGDYPGLIIWSSRGHETRMCLQRLSRIIFPSETCTFDLRAAGTMILRDKTMRAMMESS